MNLENGFSTSKKFKSQTSGNDLWWFGGGEVAWQSLAIAKTNIPTAKRPGLTIGILENGKVVEYIWQPNDVTDNGLVLKTKEITIVEEEVSNLRTFKSMQLATAALGLGKKFYWSEDNVAGVTSVNGSQLGITK